MSRDTFYNNWNRNIGFTMEEAKEKKAKVDAAYDVNDPQSKWNPAKIELDTTRPQGGYMVAIYTKE